MPKAKNPLTPEEQRKRFEDEVRKRSEAGDFDHVKADTALDNVVKRQHHQEAKPRTNPQETVENSPKK
jgi:hypothetical protein